MWKRNLYRRTLLSRYCTLVARRSRETNYRPANGNTRGTIPLAEIPLSRVRFMRFRKKIPRSSREGLSIGRAFRDRDSVQTLISRPLTRDSSRRKERLVITRHVTDKNRTTRSVPELCLSLPSISIVRLSPLVSSRPLLAGRHAIRTPGETNLFAAIPPTPRRHRQSRDSAVCSPLAPRVSRSRSLVP